MNRIAGLGSALVCAILIAACGRQDSIEKPAPQLLTREDLGYFCRMTVADHLGPKSQIILRGNGQALWFTSVRDGIAFTLLPEEPGTISAFYVTAMDDASWDHPESKMETWVHAAQAWYVIDSLKRGGMGAAETIPFGDKTAAFAFSEEFGGRVVTLADIPGNYILGNTDVSYEADVVMP